MKLQKENVIFEVVVNHIFFTRKMTQGLDFETKGESKHGHCIPMSITEWCDLNSEGNLLKVHKMYPNPNCKCQKQITSTPNHFRLEGAGFKSILQKIVEKLRLLGKNF